MHNNIYTYVFGVGDASTPIDPNGFFGKIVNSIKAKIKYILDKSDNTNKKNVAKWWDESSTDTTDNNLITAKEFYNSYFLRSNVVEGIVLLKIIEYVNKTFENETFFKKQ